MERQCTDRARIALASALERNDRIPRTTPQAGYATALDFYPAHRLLLVMANAIGRFRKRFNEHPDLVAQCTFNEKLIRSTLCGLKKVPASADQLMTAHLLPDCMKSEVSVPEVVWSSDSARLPRGRIEPGAYCLKVNHGSDMFRRVQFPLAAEETAALEATFSGYLRIDYGFRFGEWWYSVVKRRVFLERAVVSAPASIAWLFYVFPGVVELVVAY